MRQWITILLFALVFQAQAAQLKQAGIASAHPLATQAGIETLEKGGNAFDAAITVASVLAVVEPFGSGLGGGGFFLLHDAQAKGGPKNIFIDARETAPIKSHKHMYLSAEGRVLSKLSKQGPMAAGIPGEPAALAYLAQHYGALPLSETLAPAIELAKEGFVVDRAYLDAVKSRRKDLSKYPGSAHFMVDGKVPNKGFKLVQPKLAEVLEQLAANGHNGFYKSDVSQAMVASVQQAGGIWTKEDFDNYAVKVRQPLEGEYHGWKIVTAPPPSAGGLSLLTSLNILKEYETDPLSESDKVHLVVESLRRSFCDRAKYVSDPDFNHVPVSTILSQSHINLITKKLSLLKATPSSTLKCGVPASEGPQTTHFSIMDTKGNRVGATLSINQQFGSAYTEPTTGIVLNNEMDDFSVDVGASNLYGLVGHASNMIAPGKRPVSSMSPTFIESSKGVAILGTPGGSRIPSMVLLAILEAEKEPSPLAWVGKPRYHHQYLPDVISFEPEALSPSVQKALQLRGHRLEPTLEPYGNMQVVFWDNQESRMSAVSDPRKYGAGKVVKIKQIPSN